MEPSARPDDDRITLTTPLRPTSPAGGSPDRSEPVETDVLVVGAGLAGLTAAAMATRRGLRVEVLDTRSPGGRARTDERGRLSVQPGRARALPRRRGPRHARPARHPSHGRSPRHRPGPVAARRHPAPAPRQAGRAAAVEAARCAVEGPGGQAARDPATGSTRPDSPGSAARRGSTMPASGPTHGRSSRPSSTWPPTATTSPRCRPMPWCSSCSGPSATESTTSTAAGRPSCGP